MSGNITDSSNNQSVFLPYYKSLLPKSHNNEVNLPKKASKRCSSTYYRQRLERLKTNCHLIRQRRRRSMFPILPIELRPSVFQQRSYQRGSLESLTVANKDWQATNLLRLSDEYLYKCKYAMHSSTRQCIRQQDFCDFLRELFSSSLSSDEHSHESYVCELCTNSFSSSRMFDLHLSRRSVSIEYQCLTCQSLIKVTNPCQAYHHFSSHNNTTQENSIGRLSINFDCDNYLSFIDDLFTKYTSELSMS